MNKPLVLISVILLISGCASKDKLTLPHGDWQPVNAVGFVPPDVEVKIQQAMQAMPDLDAKLVADTCIDMLKDEKSLSITFDNGKEFAYHNIIANQLNTEIYFAKPYHS